MEAILIPSLFALNRIGYAIQNDNLAIFRAQKACCHICDGAYNDCRYSTAVNFFYQAFLFLAKCIPKTYSVMSMLRDIEADIY